MSEEQKQQAEKISAEINKMTPEMREKALIFMQGMAAMVQPAKSEKRVRVFCAAGKGRIRGGEHSGVSRRAKLCGRRFVRAGGGDRVRQTEQPDPADKGQHTADQHKQNPAPCLFHGKTSSLICKFL